MRRLSTYLHIDLPKERRRNDLYNMLAHLIVNILGCDEGEMLDVLRRRIANKHIDVDEFLKVSESMEVLNEDDRREMEQERKRQTEKVSESKAFKERYFEARKDYARKMPELVIGLPPLRRQPQRVAERRLLSRVRSHEVDELSQAEARSLLPDNASIWRDRLRGRWCVHVVGYRRFSRPFADGGEVGSYWRVLADAWRLSLRDRGLADDACWVPNLL